MGSLVCPETKDGTQEEGNNEDWRPKRKRQQMAPQISGSRIPAANKERYGRNLKVMSRDEKSYTANQKEILRRLAASSHLDGSMFLFLQLFPRALSLFFFFEKKK